MSTLVERVEGFSRAVAPIFQRQHQTSPRRLPEASTAVVFHDTERFRQGKPNVRLFRHWAEHSEWVRAAINIRKRQVSQAEWLIGPVDHTKPANMDLALRITQLLRKPNPKRASFRGFIEPVLEDLLVLDAGVIEKEFTLGDQVAALWDVDGGTIKVSTIWDGEPDQTRYYWQPDHQVRAELLDREMVYIMDSPATYRVVGLSPLETLKHAIDSELGASAYNDRQMRSPTPDGMLDLGENARPDQVEKFKDFWRAEVAGMGALAIIGGTKNSRFVNFRQTNRDAQFLEWQEYLVRKIAAVYMLTPMDLNQERDVNRSTGEVQQENTDDRGLKPLLGLIADYLTREVVWDEGFGGEANNLSFQYTALNLRESLTRAQINRYAVGGIPTKTINEARRDDGRPPLGDPNDESNPYNGLIINASGGLARLEDIPTAREYLDKAGQKPDGKTKLLLPEGDPQELLEV